VSYIIRRVFSGLLIVFALTWVTFALFWLLPAEPWRAVLFETNPTKAQIDAANHKLGVDRPVVVQWGKFVWGIGRHGSFGRYYGDSVNDSIKRTLPITWSIVAGGALFLFLLAVPLATISALRANTGLDRAILMISIAVWRCTRSSSASVCAPSSRTG
jgi:ABC-type dipeptide/oligopeptide/nickel transport system permease component